MGTHFSSEGEGGLVFDLQGGASPPSPPPLPMCEPSPLSPCFVFSTVLCGVYLPHTRGGTCYCASTPPYIYATVQDRGETHHGPREVISIHARERATPPPPDIGKPYLTLDWGAGKRGKRGVRTGGERHLLREKSRRPALSNRARRNGAECFSDGIV